MKDAKLTERELQYAELLAWGGARKEVAEKLGVTVSTVENTSKTIYRKIGIQKATELTVWWFVTRLKVSISLDPWKRAIVSIILLMIILPKELYGVGDTFRSVRQARTSSVRAGRARRGKKEYIDL